MTMRATAMVVLCATVLVACGGRAAAPGPASPSTAAGSASQGAADATTTAVTTPDPTTTVTPSPRPKPTPVPVPAKPTGVTFDEDAACLDDDCGRAKLTQTVLWKAPRTKGVTIRVYGVTDCLARPANPKAGAHGPCLVAHTALPDSVRTLLATASAADGWVSWSWKQEAGCETNPFGSDPRGPVYYAIVVAAYNESGHSIFTIADPGGWWEPDEGDTVC